MTYPRAVAAGCANVQYLLSKDFFAPYRNFCYLMKKLISAGLLAATALSFTAVSPAKAASGCMGGTLGMYTWGEIKAIPNFTCVIGDKTYSDFSYSSMKDDAGIMTYNPINDGDVFNFSQTGATGLTHNLNVNSANNWSNAKVMLNYKVTVSTGTNKLLNYSGNLTGDNGTQWAMSLAATNAASPSTTTNFPTFGQTATTPTKLFNANVTTTDFSNEVIANATGAGLTQFSNRLNQQAPPEVPGPLPLLGAGAAFGFSRKLRNRVKLAA